MPSLRQILDAQPVLLVVDTCSTKADAALWLNHSAGPAENASTAAFFPVHHTSVEGEAAQALPRAVASVLSAAGINVAQLDAVAFCTGPGSVLGIRLAAASVRVWRTVRPGLAVYGYLSLPLLATHPDTRGCTVIADARRETWHAVRPVSPSRIERIPSTSLAVAGDLVTPGSFRRWSALPAGNSPREMPYDPAQLIASAPDADLFTPEPDPDAFMHEQPSYATWNPQVHQSPHSTGSA